MSRKRSKSFSGKQKGILFGLFVSLVFLSVFILFSNSQRQSSDVHAEQAAPPATLQDDWPHINPIAAVHSPVQLIQYNNDVALYYDRVVDKNKARWVFDYIAKLWQYNKQHYGNGNFGPEPRVYFVLHQGAKSGGGLAQYYDPRIGEKALLDIDSPEWKKSDWTYDSLSHESAHVVESLAFGVKGSPTYSQWHDSKWAEIFQYDLYLGIGQTSEAQRLFERFSRGSDDFPRANSHWFRDWYYPIWKDYGKVTVLNNYFCLLSTNFPKKNRQGALQQEYERDITWSEYIWFMSKAAGTDLKPLATKAFGWKTAWETEYQQAQKNFPDLSTAACSPVSQSPRPSQISPTFYVLTFQQVTTPVATQPQFKPESSVQNQTDTSGSSTGALAGAAAAGGLVLVGLAILFGSRSRR